MVGIRELSTPSDYVANYKKVRHGSADAEEAWNERQAKRREKQTVIAEVAEGCSVETVRGTWLHDGQEVKPADVGGAGNLDRLRRVGAVNVITENQLKTNTGGFEFTAKKAFTHGGRIYDVGQGFDGAELDMEGTDGSQVIGPNGTLINRPGRAPVVGAEKVEDLIRGEMVERARIRDKVVATFKKRRKAAAKVEGEA